MTLQIAVRVQFGVVKLLASSTEDLLESLFELAIVNCVGVIPLRRALARRRVVPSALFCDGFSDRRVNCLSGDYMILGMTVA